MANLFQLQRSGTGSWSTQIATVSKNSLVCRVSSFEDHNNIEITPTEKPIDFTLAEIKHTDDDALLKRAFAQLGRNDKSLNADLAQWK